MSQLDHLAKYQQTQVVGGSGSGGYDYKHEISGYRPGGSRAHLNGKHVALVELKRLKRGVWIK